jgi:hypothetical protein
MTSTQRISSLLVAAALAAFSGAVLAAAGTVSQLSGTLSVQKADGTVRILAQKSEIQPGDTLNTQRDSYAQIKFADGGQVTIKPNTSIRIERFSFDQAQPQQDSFLFNLVKGGLRAVTGLVGKRGNPDAYRLGTTTATIGIRGTTYGTDDCTGEAAGQGQCQNLADAVYVSVSDGEVVATNDAGSVRYLAGQFGLIESRDRLPRFLSTDPGLQFTPPASFIQSITGGTAVNAGKSMECVVRR